MSLFMFFRLVIHYFAFAEKCEVEKADDGDLGIENVGGVFVVLGAGCLVALVVAFCEFLWNVQCLAIEERVRKLMFFY